MALTMAAVASRDVEFTGMRMPSPPLRAGSEKMVLSKSRTSPPNNAGRNMSQRAASSGRKKASESGITLW